jgi:hypothetical protein
MRLAALGSVLLGISILGTSRDPPLNGYRRPLVLKLRLFPDVEDLRSFASSNSAHH